ncbi:hypothetical protein ACI1MP_37500 (plasmid) [Kitasatospora griseola]|uniref:hypothetical protein n=1 Tax=Kitasatospora griseola TaxID=2064 RepID=UPI003855B5F4
MSTETSTLDAAEGTLLRWLHEQITLSWAAGSSRQDPLAGWAHQSVYELVLAHGRWCTPAPLPAGIWPLAEQECFANAADTEAAHPGLLYTEGFAMVEGLPMALAHAWCTTADGDVVDPTWTDLPGAAYLGIPLARTGPRPTHPTYPSVLEHPASAYPLLQYGLAVDLVAARGRAPLDRTLPEPWSSR